MAVSEGKTANALMGSCHKYTEKEQSLMYPGDLLTGAKRQQLNKWSKSAVPTVFTTKQGGAIASITGVVKCLLRKHINCDEQGNTCSVNKEGRCDTIDFDTKGGNKALQEACYEMDGEVASLGKTCINVRCNAFRSDWHNCKDTACFCRTQAELL